MCNGQACKSELPGMGGVRENENFMLNVCGWKNVRKEYREKIESYLSQSVEFRIPKISVAPMTGAVENMGYGEESEYYEEIANASSNVGIGLCLGDGFPDEKLKFGIRAIERIREREKNAMRASVFIKPYSNERIIERIGWASKIADLVGIDIDSYNILTMRNLVNLEKKDAARLSEIRDFVHGKLGVPFSIKGIFTDDDIELVKKVHPDVAYISNHGGRIDTRTGSTAEYLAKNAAELRKWCGEVWVDGGIRTPLDVATAHALGADRVLIGRPFVTALCQDGERGVCGKVLEMSMIRFGAGSYRDE